LNKTSAAGSSLPLTASSVRVQQCGTSIFYVDQAQQGTQAIPSSRKIEKCLAAHIEKGRCTLGVHERFLTTSDPETARYASELCGKADRTQISYTVSESSTNANVGWLSGRTSSSKGSVSASKQYQKRKEPLFEEKVFFDLKNAQAVVVAFDGVTPLPPTLLLSQAGLPARQHDMV
jgi:hypothetical protein